MRRTPYQGIRTEARFWAKVDPFGPVSAYAPHLGRCWVWKAAKTPRGYGRFGSRKLGTKLAHRYAYELFLRPIPDGMTLDHLCFNTSCVNPRHLEPTTTEENSRRAGVAGRMDVRWNTGLTHCKHGHEFTPENTRLGRHHGERHCRTCDGNAKAKRTEKRRLARIEKYGYDPGPLARFDPSKVTA